MPKTLKTPTSVWTAVFRCIVQQLENDPTVKRVIGLQNLRFMEGHPRRQVPDGADQLGPRRAADARAASVEWYSEAAQAGWLHVDVEMALSTLCIDDLADLWDILVNALRPGAADSKGNSFAGDLVALGAETGTILFSDPGMAVPPPGDWPEGFMFGRGSFTLRVIREN